MKTSLIFAEFKVQGRQWCVNTSRFRGITAIPDHIGSSGPELFLRKYMKAVCLKLLVTLPFFIYYIYFLKIGFGTSNRRGSRYRHHWHHSWHAPGLWVACGDPQAAPAASRARCAPPERAACNIYWIGPPARAGAKSMDFLKITKKTRFLVENRRAQIGPGTDLGYPEHAYACPNDPQTHQSVSASLTSSTGRWSDAWIAWVLSKLSDFH